MKKFIILAVLVSVCLSSYAYYSDYSYSSYGTSSPFSEIIQIIMFIGGILEIILFFKIWGMTNNIKKLKKEYFSESISKIDQEQFYYLRKNLMLGKTEKVKEALILNFLENIAQNYTNKNASIRPYVDNLQKQFDKIGEELPVYISQMNTFGDYYDMFTKEDFIVNKENNKEDYQTVIPIH